MKKDDFLSNEQLRKKILDHIKNGKYRLSKHDSEEQAKDGLDVQDTLYVLEMEVHERDKTSFDNMFQT